MTKLIFIVTCYMALALLVYIGCKNEDIKVKTAGLFFACIFAVAFLTRIYFATRDLYFGYDMSCFEAWGELCRQRGFKNMYTGDFFLDYPPMYIYVLWLGAVLRNALGIAYGSLGNAFIIKLGPVIRDMVLGFLVYKTSQKRLGDKWALGLSSLWLLNPAVIYNSSVWGQVDSFYILFLVLAVFFAEENKTVPASVCYAIALLTKPQALLFGPVFLFYIINRKDIKQFFVAAGVGLSSVWVLALPFSKGLSPLWLINLYKNTMNGYRLFTFNGYNLYALLGLNQTSLTKYSMSGFINVAVICLVLLMLAVANKKDKGPGDYFENALVLITVIFTFCTMMHERYILPAVAMALFTCIYTKREKFYLCFLAISAFSYLNIAHTMMVQIQEYEYTDLAVKSIGFFCVLCAVIVMWGYSERLSGLKFKFNRKCTAITILLILVSVMQFYKLGSFNAPATFYQAENQGDWFVIAFEQPQQVEKVYTFLGLGDEYQGQRTPKTKCDFTLSMPDEYGLWTEVCNLNHNFVFTWKSEDVSFYTDKVLVRAASAGAVLNEIVLLNADGNIIYGHIDGESEGAKYPPALALDESHFMPEDFRNYYYSSYFDEIYFARTGYEMLKGYSVYETTHPPVGKILISIGIFLFGMTPFGWRFMGALAGILSVGFLYLLVKEIFKKEKVAMFSATLYALDFMRYTQTRIATVDSFLVLFVILMFLFMAKYENCQTGDTPSEVKNLFLSGLFMGLCIGTKWNGAYSAVGLALYFFFILFKKCRDFESRTDKTSYFIKTVLKCVLFFVVIPLCIYFISFYPVIRNSGTSPIKRFIDCQKNMFSYHSNLVAEHFFSSPWYSWLVIYKPVWYRVSRSGDMVSTISAMGNPAIWLLFPLAVLLCLRHFAKERDSAYFVATVGYLTSLLPWVMVTRLTFIYHYYPCTVFGIIAITAIFSKFTDGFEKNGRNKVAICYLALCLCAFLLFFPVISGNPASAELVNSLEILPQWYFA